MRPSIRILLALAAAVLLFAVLRTAVDPPPRPADEAAAPVIVEGAQLAEAPPGSSAQQASAPLPAGPLDEGGVLSPYEVERERVIQLLVEVGLIAGLTPVSAERATILLAELEDRFAEGDAVAGMMISLIYEADELGVQDLQQARLWLERAAEAGSMEARVRLAIRLKGGWDQAADPVRALRILESLAAEGVTEIDHMLLDLYANGRPEQGLGPDQQRAHEIEERIMSGDGSYDVWHVAELRLERASEVGYGPALEAYLRAGESGLQFAYLQAGLIQLHCVGDPAGAVEVLERASPKDEWHWVSLADSYAASGRWEDAIAAQEEAVGIMSALSRDDEPLLTAQVRLDAYRNYQPLEPLGSCPGSD